MRWFVRWSHRERRRAERYNDPQLIAYYWDGAQPSPHSVRDISFSGTYIVTGDRWHPGTLVMITLQRAADPGDGKFNQSIRMQSKVIRSGQDGVGFAFVFPGRTQSRDGSLVFPGANRKALKSFCRECARIDGLSHQRTSIRFTAMHHPGGCPVFARANLELSIGAEQAA